MAMRNGHCENWPRPSRSRLPRRRLIRPSAAEACLARSRLAGRALRLKAAAGLRLAPLAGIMPRMPSLADSTGCSAHSLWARRFSRAALAAPASNLQQPDGSRMSCCSAAWWPVSRETTAGALHIAPATFNEPGAVPLGLMPIDPVPAFWGIKRAAASSPVVQRTTSAPAAPQAACCANQTRLSFSRRLPPVLLQPLWPTPAAPVDFQAAFVARGARVNSAPRRRGWLGAGRGGLPAGCSRRSQVPSACGEPARRLGQLACADSTDRRSAVRWPTAAGLWRAGRKVGSERSHRTQLPRAHGPEQGARGICGATPLYRPPAGGTESRFVVPRYKPNRFQTSRGSHWWM